MSDPYVRNNPETLKRLVALIQKLLSHEAKNALLLLCDKYHEADIADAVEELLVEEDLVERGGKRALVEVGEDVGTEGRSLADGVGPARLGKEGGVRRVDVIVLSHGDSLSPDGRGRRGAAWPGWNPTSACRSS